MSGGLRYNAFLYWFQAGVASFYVRYYVQASVVLQYVVLTFRAGVVLRQLFVLFSGDSCVASFVFLQVLERMPCYIICAPFMFVLFLLLDGSYGTVLVFVVVMRALGYMFVLTSFERKLRYTAFLVTLFKRHSCRILSHWCFQATVALQCFSRCFQAIVLLQYVCARFQADVVLQYLFLLFSSGACVTLVDSIVFKSVLRCSICLFLVSGGRCVAIRPLRFSN